MKFNQRFIIRNKRVIQLSYHKIGLEQVKTLVYLGLNHYNYKDKIIPFQEFLVCNH